MISISNIKDRVFVALARRFFLFFCLYVVPDFVQAKHHVKIALVLDLVTAGKLRFVQFAMPPRHGKSFMCSELYPPYWLGRNPSKQIILCSYASSLSDGFSIKVRARIATDERYKRVFPHVALDPNRKRVDDWKLVTGGGLRSVGVGGGITGIGGDLVIIDDPHKEGDEQSVRIMKAVYDWWTSAVRTRLSPGAPVLFIMTRWHPLDLAGRLQALAASDPLADQWYVLSFPAIAVADDILGRKTGEALWPERFPVVELMALKRLSERYFEALYQQNPKFSNEPLFELSDFVRVDSAEYINHCDYKTFWSVDLAITDDTRSDYTVIGLWSYNRVVRELVLHKTIRFRRQWPVVKRKLTYLIRVYPWPVYLPKHMIELLTVQALKDENPYYAHKVHEVSLPGDKTSRASHLADFCKSGSVLVDKNAGCDIFVDEHVAFGEADHDDCVDMSSVATHACGIHEEFKLLMLGVGDVGN